MVFTYSIQMISNYFIRELNCDEIAHEQTPNAHEA